MCSGLFYKNSVAQSWKELDGGMMKKNVQKEKKSIWEH